MKMAHLSEANQALSAKAVKAWHIGHVLERHVLVGQLALFCVDCGVSETIDSIEAKATANAHN
jgi:hypothetical protein